MARVFLFEDTGGALYLHREGDPNVLSGVELAVPYGAEFLRDAEALAQGAAPGDNNQQIPYEEFEAQIGQPTVRAIAVWNEGNIKVLHSPGPNARTYMGEYHSNSTSIQPGYQK